MLQISECTEICKVRIPSGPSGQRPYPFWPFGPFPPDRGNRPLEPKGSLGALLRQCIIENKLWMLQPNIQYFFYCNREPQPAQLCFPENSCAVSVFSCIFQSKLVQYRYTDFIRPDAFRV